MLLAEGERVAGRFTVDQLIAEGGLSEVYKVRHIELGSVHALKLLRAEHPTITKRLLMEGRIQAQLTHPNIAPVTDVVRHQGRVGLLMPLIEGKSMAELLELRKQMPVDEALQLMTGVLCGVGAAHGAGVLHRDIKPGNVLLMSTRGGVRPLVTDFGIAKVAEGLANVTRVGSAMGTPGYSAPEQVLDAADVDVRADIFSLGAMLYRMLTGVMPYVSADGSVRIGSVVSEPYTPLDQAADELSPALCAAVDKALARSADARFQDVNEMAQALLHDRPELLARVLAPSGIGPINFELPTLEPEAEDGEDTRYVGIAGATLMPEMSNAFAEDAALGASPPTLAPVPAPVPAPASAGADAGAAGPSPVLWVGVVAALLLGGLGLWWWSTPSPEGQTVVVLPPPQEPVTAALRPPQEAPSIAEGAAEQPEVDPTPVSDPVPQGAATPSVPPEGGPAASPSAGSSEPGDVAPDPGPAPASDPVVQPSEAEPMQPVEPVTSPAGEGTDLPQEEDGLASADVGEEAGSSATLEPSPPEPEAPLEPAPWAGPDVSGAWSGTAGGRPATMLLKMGPEGQITGELVFILGATRRSFPVRGAVDAQGRIRLSAGEDLQMSGQASDASINGTYTQGRSKDQSIRLNR